MKTQKLPHDGRNYSLIYEPSGWRLRCRAKLHRVDYRTGTQNITEARRRAKEWLKRNADEQKQRSRGGGTLERLCEVYAATPTRTRFAADNISRLRAICRLTLGRELSAITCREINPEFWQQYQRKALERAGHAFDLTTRHRANLAINAAMRSARALFLPALMRAYRAAGLDPRPDAAEAVMLPQPYVPPVEVDEARLLKSWAALRDTDLRMWLTIGLARFAGLRRKEIMCARVGWIELHAGACRVALRDRPEEQWWTKTGKPYFAQVIHPLLIEHLTAALASEPREALIVPEPPPQFSRFIWFELEPQKWLRAHGDNAAKPLHRLRGLYADEVAQLTADAITRRLEATRAAQEALGHTTSKTTEGHYLTPGKLR